MPIKTIIDPELRKKAAIVYSRCQQNEASRWMAMGARVNYSFYESRQIFTHSAIVEALKDLGVDYHTIPKQTKWYEFWKDDDTLRLHAAISKVTL